MEPKVATDGGWSRLNWALVAILTAVGWPLVAAAHGCGGSAAALTAPETP